MGNDRAWHSKDCLGFRAFLEEAAKAVHAIEEAACDRPREARLLHTLGCNAARFGFPGLAQACDALARRLARGHDDLGVHERRELSRLFHQVLDAYPPVDEGATITIDEDEYAELLDLLVSGAPRQALIGRVESLALAPIRGRLARFAEDAAALAVELGRARVETHVETHGARHDERRFAPFWSAFVHAVANAVEHGIETPEERLAAGKPRTARLELTAESREGRLFVELRDDGRGMEWGRLAARARALGLTVHSERDLAEAVFWDGVSCSDPETSGRGLGLGALREACEALGGTVQLESVAGVGTTVRCAFPQIGRWPRAARSASVLPPRALERLVRDTLRSGSL